MFSRFSTGILIFIMSIGIGIIVYSILLGILWLTNKRRTLQIRHAIFEMLLISYMLTILNITGIWGMKFYFSDVFNGMYNMNLILFKDASIGMLILNFLLFVPYGFLLPCVFKNLKSNGKKVLLIGFITSFSIEFLQLFGGRFAEIDDILVNSLGVFVGFVIFSYISNIKYKINKVTI